MGLFSGITNSLFGKGGSGTAQKAVEEAKKLAKDVYFKPYTVTTSLGTLGYDPTTGSTTSAIDPALAGIQASALGGAGSMFDQAASFDPTERASQIFSEQAALLQPQFEQQRQQMQQDLFGSGRLGMRLASGAAGAGEGGGMVQPDAFGLGLAQQQTLAGLTANARSQAFQEQGQLQEMASGMLAAGMAPAQMEQQLIALGIDAETARSAAAMGAGQLAMDPYNTLAQMKQADKRGAMDFVGGLGGSLFGAAGNAGGFSGLFSDERLKKDIKKIKVMSNGINVYSWNWIDESIDQPTVGVIAQEIMDVIPEAVTQHESGFYQVDYSHPELKEIYNV